MQLKFQTACARPEVTWEAPFWCHCHGRTPAILRHVEQLLLMDHGPFTLAQDPIPLKRVWVIWEIFSAFQMGARFDIAMCHPHLSSARQVNPSDASDVSALQWLLALMVWWACSDLINLP